MLKKKKGAHKVKSNKNSVASTIEGSVYTDDGLFGYFIQIKTGHQTITMDSGLSFNDPEKAKTDMHNEAIFTKSILSWTENKTISSKGQHLQ